MQGKVGLKKSGACISARLPMHAAVCYKPPTLIRPEHALSMREAQGDGKCQMPACKGFYWPLNSLGLTSHTETEVDHAIRFVINNFNLR